MSPDWAAKVEPVPYAEMDDPQSLNLYAYVRGNPLRSTDPDGHVDNFFFPNIDAMSDPLAALFYGAWQRSLAQKAQQQNLSNAQNAAMKNPKFAPGYGGHTHCNQGACSVARAMHAPMGPFSGCKSFPCMANQIRANLAKPGSGYHGVSDADAAQLAGHGVVVYITGPRAHIHCSRQSEPEAARRGSDYRKRRPREQRHAGQQSLQTKRYARSQVLRAKPVGGDMKRQIRTAIFGCALSLLLVLSSYCATGQQKPETTYNGHWWLAITQQEQSGFLNGYFDCYTYEYKGPARFTDHPPAIARDLVTKFYKENPSRLHDLVSKVFLGLRDRPGETITDRAGEPINGPHGSYDGLYWMQISADTGPQMEQLGFVEGYLACHARLDHNKGGTFSKPVAEYVRLITQWYGFNRYTDDVNAKRQPTAIADVLFKFRDQAQSGNALSK